MGEHTVNWTDSNPCMENQFPTQLKFELKNKKVVSIAYDQCYSIVVTQMMVRYIIGVHWRLAIIIGKCIVLRIRLSYQQE